MVSTKCSININVDREMAFKAAEKYPDFVTFFLRGSRILSQNDERISVEVHSRILGLPTKWRGIGEKQKPDAIRFRQTEGLFKGLQAEWLFEEQHPASTTVTITTVFEKPYLPKIVERWLGFSIVERTTQKILRELKKYAESQTDHEKVSNLGEKTE